MPECPFTTFRSQSHQITACQNVPSPPWGVGPTQPRPYCLLQLLPTKFRVCPHHLTAWPSMSIMAIRVTSSLNPSSCYLYWLHGLGSRHSTNIPDSPLGFYRMSVCLKSKWLGEATYVWHDPAAAQTSPVQSSGRWPPQRGTRLK